MEARRDGVVVTPVHLNLLFTILAALLVLSAGRILVSRTALLQRFSIPPPVVGGVLIAIVLALADTFGALRVSFDMSLRDNLLLMFFTTVGLSADARMLFNGGPKLLIFLGISALFIAIQNFVGIAAALAMDLHPLVGLLGGSITLTGGHGTGAAYGGRFGETMNLVGSMELTMACATAGLVLGSVLGGPLAEFLITRYKLAPTAVPEAEADVAAARDDDPVTVQTMLNVLLAVMACLAFGKLMAKLVAGTGFILPDFLFCLLLGVVIRNTAAWIPPFRLSNATVDLTGGVALSLFLVMALMGMRLVDLVSLAGPLLVILGLQMIVMALYADVRDVPRDGTRLRRGRARRRARRIRVVVHRRGAGDHEDDHAAARAVAAGVRDRSDGWRVFHRHRQCGDDPGLSRLAAIWLPIMSSVLGGRRLPLGLLAAVIVAGGCTRGADEARLRSDLQERLNRDVKAGLFEVVAVRREGSAPLPSTAAGAPRVIVYFNATLRLAEDYGFGGWDQLSPSSVAYALGATEKGVFGLNGEKRARRRRARARKRRVRRERRRLGPWHDGRRRPGQGRCPASRPPDRRRDPSN